MKRLGIPLAICFVLASVPLLSSVGWRIPAASQQAELAAPQPSTAIQQILDVARQLAEAEQPLEALQAAERALALARQNNDPVGEALAQGARAWMFQALDQTGEAVAAWQQCAEAWKGAGDVPGQVEALGMVATLLLSQKKPADAEQSLEEALAVAQTEANQPLRVAAALQKAGHENFERGVPLELAREFFEAALRIREKLVPESLETAGTLNELGNVISLQGDPGVAEQYHQRALLIRETLAPNSLHVAHSLHALGLVEQRRGNLAAAESYYTRALAIKERLAPNSMDLTTTLGNLGNVADSLGDLKLSEKLHQRALAILEKIAPNDHAYMAYHWNTLGIVAAKRGDLVAAREYWEHTLDSDEKLGSETINMALTLTNLGIAASGQGDFAAAWAYFQQSLAIHERLAPENEAVARLVGNLGTLAVEQGDMGLAEQYYRRALAFCETHGYFCSQSFVNLGYLELRRGNLTAAEDFFHRVLPEVEEAEPGFRPWSLLGSLGEVARRKGHRQAALDYTERALALAETQLPDSGAVAALLSRLGLLALEDGNRKAAEEYHRRALAIQQQASGEDHPEVARTLNHLAEVHAETGMSTKAFEEALRAEKIGSEHLRLAASTLPERQALLYDSVRISGLDLALSLAVEWPSEIAKAPQVVWDSLIGARALVLDEMAARHRVVGEASDPEITRVARELTLARTRLARLVVRGARDDPPERYRGLLDDTRREKEEAERALAEKSMVFRQEQARRRIGLEEVAAALPPESVLVAYARYNQHNLAANNQPGTADSDGVPSYAAFVLRGPEREPVLVSLGLAQDIEDLVVQARQGIAEESLAPGRSSKRMEAAYRRTGEELRQRVWDPIAPHLGDAKRVFVVPDGALHLVNLAALPVGRGDYLIDRGLRIHYLSAERDLVPAMKSHKGDGLLAIGAPAYDETSLFAVLATEPEEKERADSAQVAGESQFRGNRSVCGAFQALRFEPLPASAQEVGQIAALWGKAGDVHRKEYPQLRSSDLERSRALVRLGAQANEAVFKQEAIGRRVLHLATHGFFLGGRCPSALEASRKPGEEEKPTPVLGENPLLLAGLALAGANHRQAAGTDEEDGILTAEEIAVLDLKGVEWAVLSACDTGVGQVKVGEGVLGLRRAFQVAGAKTVIMSLWPVEDTAAQQWMTKLYEGRFLKGLNTVDAVHEANLGLLRERRAKKQNTHPFYWAGFVAAGDWR